MTTYLAKPTTIKKNLVLTKEFSFSGFSYRSINIKNKNIENLSSILSKNIKGFEPGSREYINFSENYFVRISEMNDLNFSFDITKDTKKIRPLDNANKSKYIMKGDICYQTASNVGNICFYDGKKAFFNSHIRQLDFKTNKFYVFAILKSNFGKEQVVVSGSIKGVDNFREELLLNTKIPFPTIKNNTKPEQIEILVSLIVQNILHKEEQIKEKNYSINKKIDLNINNNQKNSKFIYSYPKISDIKVEGRFDTGIFERKYTQNIFKIKNFKNGYFFIKDLDYKYISGLTPEVYIPSNDNTDYLWIAVADLEYGLMYKKPVMIKVKDKVKNMLNDGDILITRKGATVGKLNIFFKDVYKNAFVNEDLKILRLNIDQFKKIFIGLFLNSQYGQIQLLNHGSKGTKQGLTNDNILDVLIPKFSDETQKEIAILFYNKIQPNKNLTFLNYLEKEKIRNEKLGIFQLNMELFSLRTILEQLIHKITMDKKIEINFEY